MTTDLAKMARDLKPYILPWLTAGTSGGGSTSGSYGVHELGGPLHTGTLAQAQAPWAATVSALQAHALNPNARHNAATGGDGIDVSGAQVVSLKSTTAGNGLAYAAGVLSVNVSGLGLSVASDAVTLTSSNNVSAAQTSILNATSGALTVATLTGTTSVTTPSLLSSADLSIDAAGGDVVFDYDDALHSDELTPGFPYGGWRIGPTSVDGQSGMNIGSLEADELRARIFVADETRVDRGQEYITKSYGVLSRAFTAPSAVSGTAYIHFENSPHIAGALFTSNDWILLRYLDMSSGITLTSVWGQVSSYYTTGLTGEQRWTFTLRSGTGGLEFGKGAMAVNFGASGQGYILSDAVSSTAPFVQVGKWVTNPYTPANRTVSAAMGRLDGVGFTGEYGFAATKDTFTASGTWWKASTGGVAQNNVDAGWSYGGVPFFSITPADGLSVYVPEDYVARNALSFADAPGGTLRGELYTYRLSNRNYVTLAGYQTGTHFPIITLKAEATGTASIASVILKVEDLSGSQVGSLTLKSTSLNITTDVSSDGRVSALRFRATTPSSATAPALSTDFSTQTGIYGYSSNQAVGLTAQGVHAGYFTSTSAVLPGTLVVGSWSSFSGGDLVAHWSGAPYHGYAIAAASASGWARKFGFFNGLTAGGSGGFGAYGAAGSLGYWWVGNAYDDRTLLIYPTTHATYPGYVDVAGGLSAPWLNASTALQRDGVGGGIYTPLTPVNMTDAGSTVWNGTPSRGVATYTFDVNTAANGSVPAEAVAVSILLSGQWSSSNNGYYAVAHKGGTAASANSLQTRALVASRNVDMTGVVALDSNGQFHVTVAGATMESCQCRVVGYYI